MADGSGSAQNAVGVAVFWNLGAPADPEFRLLNVEGEGLADSHFELAHVFGSDTSLPLSVDPDPPQIRLDGIAVASTEALLWTAWAQLESVFDTPLYDLSHRITLYLDEASGHGRQWSWMYRKGPLMIERVGPFTIRWSVLLVGTDAAAGAGYQVF